MIMVVAKACTRGNIFLKNSIKSSIKFSLINTMLLDLYNVKNTFDVEEPAF